MQETFPGPDGTQLTEQHRELLDQVLDKWSLQILDSLCERPLRFNELRRAIPVVTQKSLTTALRRLERNGMIERVVTSTVVQTATTDRPVTVTGPGSTRTVTREVTTPPVTQTQVETVTQPVTVTEEVTVTEAVTITIQVPPGPPTTNG